MFCVMRTNKVCRIQIKTVRRGLRKVCRNANGSEGGLTYASGPQPTGEVFLTINVVNRSLKS